jgi:hypothetical protein
MHPTQIAAIENYFHDNPSQLPHYLPPIIEHSAQQIDERWMQMLENINRCNIRLRLVIFAEAPLSYHKYFYNRPGNFLSGLKSYYNDTFQLQLRNDNFIEYLNQRGVLLVDLYRFPLPAAFYRTHHELFTDAGYIATKLNTLLPLMDDKTKFTFRYKMLLNRGLHHLAPFADYQEKFIRRNGVIQTIFQQERPQIINQALIPYV